MSNDGMRMYGACKRYPMFFKVYLPELDAEKLMIPRSFVKQFGVDLSDVAALTIPDGRVWRLGLFKAESTIFFHDGWQEFVEYYSILIGYFLVFSYKGTSNFHVSIFDRTSCEIDCLFSGPSCEQGSNHNKQYMAIDEEETDDGGSIESFDLSETSKERVSDKRLREQAFKKKCNPSLNQDSYPIIDSMGSLRNRNGYELGSKKCRIEEQLEIEYLGNTNENKQDKSSGKTKNRDSYGKKYAENFQPLDHDLNFQINQNKIKQTYCYGNLDDSFNDDQQAKTANGVGSGSKNSKPCGLKLSAKSKHHADIIASQGLSSMYTKISQKGRRAIHAAKLLKPKRPSFMVVLGRRCFLTKTMYVPSEFSRKYLRRDSKCLTILDSVGRRWPVIVSWKTMNAAFLSRGLCGFFRYYTLKEEDVCVFELIETSDTVLKMSIFRASK